MIRVVYACDDSYIRQTLISMASVWNANVESEIYLITDELSQDAEAMICHILQKYKKNIIRISLKSVLSGLRLDEKDRHPNTIYAKLFLAEWLDADRVLYLDSDIVASGSLQALFERDMTKELAAGVLMPYGTKVKRCMGIRSGEPYICDGAVLLNLKLWRELRKSEECKRHICEHGGKPPMLSEGTLNNVCQGAIGVLEPAYNLMPSMLLYSLPQMRKLFRSDCYYQDEQELADAVQNPILIHYMNELYNRPWLEPCGHPLRDVYLKLEEELFGECRTERKELPLHTRMTVWMRKHLPFSLFAVMYHLKNGI